MQSCKIRPHHGLCTAFFIGKGYSSEFTDNMHEKIAMLEMADPMIILTSEADIICEKCPNNADGRCTGSKPYVYDGKVLDILGINEDIQLKWSSFRDKVRRNIIENGRLSEVCNDCRWYGICSSLSLKI